MSNDLTPAQERKREKNRRYWAEREEEALKHYIQEEKEYDKQIAQIYKRMIDACNTEIAAFYGRYASKEGITLAEAKKRVSQLDIEAYERKAKQYVKERNFSKQANEEMRLYNAVMKINRLEMLKANIGLELIKGHDDLNAFMSDILQGRTVEELERQAGILGETINENAKLAHTIPNASFHNATFSQRIWANQTVLRNEISSLLQTGLIQGKNPRVLARELREKVDTSQYNAERLMRTELARVQTAAQKASLESMNIELYQFHANSGCCDICRAVAARDTGYSETGVYKVASMMPGENASPLHPNCRCSVSPYSDEAEYQAWLDHLDKGGTTEEWNRLKKKRKSVEKPGENDIIKLRKISNRNMSNGMRGSPYHILSEDEINSLKEDAKVLDIPESILRFNAGSQTGFSDQDVVINIRGDVLPDLSSSALRDVLSQRAVLAHEYYGHYKNHPSAFRVGDWRDEFRASYRAAIDSPGLSDEERRMLMLDAYDRAKEAGIEVRYNKEARRLIYGQDE